MKTKFILLSIACFFLLSMQPVMANPNPPAFLLIKAEGTVEYCKGQNKWKRIRRNKFLFDKYQVKTIQNSSCQLIDEKNQKSYIVQENSQIKISNNQIITIKGKIYEGQKPGHFENYWEKKFTKVQEYTAALRTKMNKNIKLILKDMVLSNEFPEIIWENQGSEYSYRLHINNKIYQVSGVEGSIVRYIPKRLPAGKYSYQVEVVDEFGDIISPSEKKSSLIWLSEKESQKIVNRIHEIDTNLNNSFIIANFLEDKGLNVPAMDYYKRYFSNNPHENEMRPYLINIYRKLGLKTLRNDECKIYKQNMQKN
ncbi:conserved hypothetical protein, secreted [Candidatus Magnetomorum sp. HK-1]|nr:conserved hypothetical protein, secreted [Candidatus Magnetomorum sp. HK-1]